MKYNKIVGPSLLTDSWYLVGEGYKDMNTATSTRWNMEHVHGEQVEFRVYENIHGVIEMWGRRKNPFADAEIVMSLDEPNLEYYLEGGTVDGAA